MSKKESREVNRSQVKETLLLTSVQEAVNDTFNRMRGRIYNVIEASFSDSKRAESMKALVRDITGDAWNDLPVIIFKVMQRTSESKEEKSENK